MARPLYRTLAALYENYASDVAEVEDRSRAERREEDQFLDEVMRTKVMAATLRFLRDNKVFTGSAAEFRQLLAELWFSVYSRGRRILGSSGFEHVFLGEKKNGAVQARRYRIFNYYYCQLTVLSNISIIGCRVSTTGSTSTTSSSGARSTISATGRPWTSAAAAPASPSPSSGDRSRNHTGEYFS